MIIMFIGPSNSGKDTYYILTLNKFAPVLKPIILSTSRPIRKGEIPGITYQFLTTREMEELDQKGLLLERRDYNTVNGIWTYATSKEDVELSEDYLTINTWDGYDKYVAEFGENMVFPVYFDVDPGVRLQRALNREKMQKLPDYKEMCRRFIKDLEDFKEERLNASSVTRIDNNGTIDQTQQQVNEAVSLILKRKDNQL